jgi:hypothetical protein
MLSVKFSQQPMALDHMRNVNKHKFSIAHRDTTENKVVMKIRVRKGAGFGHT